MSGGFEGNLLLEDDVVSVCAGLVDIVEPGNGRKEFAFTRGYNLRRYNRGLPVAEDSRRFRFLGGRILRE